MEYLPYKLLCYFFIYAFLGWIAEIIYTRITDKEFVNRGFLNGPICPIYGIGILAVILVLSPLKDNLILLFIGSILLTSILEFIVGLILKKLFNEKWWDYLDRPYNIKGYVCLSASLAWGLGCLLIIKIVHPLIENITSLLPKNLEKTISTVMLIMCIVDIIITLATLTNFKKAIYIINAIERKVKRIISLKCKLMKKTNQNHSNSTVQFIEELSYET